MIRWMMIVGLCLFLNGRAFAEPVTVYAAASLTSVLQDLSVRAKKHDLNMRLSFGSSSTLAKQIALGAPADIYFSANVKWMDYLAEQDLLEPDTRMNMLGNTLVMVVPKGESFRVDVQSTFDFATAFQGRLSVGNPSHVPAGMYAKEALEKLGWWPALKDRIAPAEDARGALMLVARGECPVGIVYATDAVIDAGVEVIATLPDSLLQVPIVYPVAVVKGQQSPKVEDTLRFLQSAEADSIFQRYGFRLLMAN